MIKINPNAQETGGANGALQNQDSARTVPSRFATRHIAAHDEMSGRSALRSYLAVLGVSAAVVGIATGFGELPWRQVAKKNMRHDMG